MAGKLYLQHLSQCGSTPDCPGGSAAEIFFAFGTLSNESTNKPFFFLSKKYICLSARHAVLFCFEVWLTDRFVHTCL